MTVDVSSFGSVLTLVCSRTYPIGFLVTAFPDNKNGIEFPDLQIADGAMGPNGDAVKWSIGQLIKMNVSVIPNTPSDIGLNILFQANRVARGKNSVKDIITATIVLPNGRVTTLSRGFITNGNPSSGIEQTGRLETRTYGFSFESLVSV